MYHTLGTRRRFAPAGHPNGEQPNCKGPQGRGRGRPTGPTSGLSREEAQGGHFGLRVCGSRLGACAGRGPHKRLAQLAGQERNDGDVYLNLIHVDDIVAAMQRLIDVDYHGALNLSDDSPTLRREFYDRILAVSGLPPIQWTPRAGPARGKRVRNNRIKSLLNLSLRHPMH